jgi:hypothetical protein
MLQELARKVLNYAQLPLSRVEKKKKMIPSTIMYISHKKDSLKERRIHFTV